MKSEIMEKLLEGLDEFYAHRKEENGEVVRETLPEHTRLTSEYFHQLWDRKNIREMTGRLKTDSRRNFGGGKSLLGRNNAGNTSISRYGETEP